MNMVVSLIVALLSNQMLMKLLVKWLEKLADKDDTAVDEEYADAQHTSIAERLAGTKP